MTTETESPGIVAPEAPSRRRPAAIFATAEMLAIYRRRYPDGLICTGCSRLVATVGYGGRPYECAGCRIEAPALAKEAKKRFDALARRGTLPEARGMRVLARAFPDPGWSPARKAEFERTRPLALALMGVPVARTVLGVDVGGNVTDPTREPASVRSIRVAFGTTPQGSPFCPHSRPAENCAPCRLGGPVPPAERTRQSRARKAERDRKRAYRARKACQASTPWSELRREQ